MEVKEDEVVMCTVKKIEGTTVFLEIEGDGEGTMVMPEVAAGRIRNLREYVYPNKKIVCKILKIINGHPQLSLRRVTAKERDDVIDRYTKERTFTNMLKAVLKNPEEAINKIKEKYEIADFFDEVKEHPETLDKFLKKEEAESIKKILSEKKEKEKVVKSLVILKSDSSSGIEDLKEILNVKNVEIKYLGSSKFDVISIAKDFKEANSQLASALQQIEKKAKEKKAFVEIKEK